MHPRDAPLWADVACGAQLVVVCPAGETDYDVIFPVDDRGGGVAFHTAEGELSAEGGFDFYLLMMSVANSQKSPDQQQVVRPPLLT